MTEVSIKISNLRPGIIISEDVFVNTIILLLEKIPNYYRNI